MNGNKAQAAMLDTISHYRNAKQNYCEALLQIRLYNGYNEKLLSRPKAGEDAEIRDHSHTAGGNAEWHSHSEKQCGSFF